MKIAIIWLIALFAAFSGLAGDAAAKSKTELAELAISSETSVSAEAIKDLRALGQEGLNALREKYAAEIASFAQSGEKSEKWQRIAAALDAVAMQRDAYASGLYWFTDFEAARLESEKTRKPILSLRLLGNLNEEFSCANSRFFRALLYSNAEISNFLREHYVLHWKSVRPAPRITIDFGDGRRIERTITGNSIHYILEPNGAIVDALPGLYAPAAFLQNLTRAGALFERLEKLPAAEQEKALLSYRRAQFDAIKAKRDQAVTQAKVKLTAPKDGTSAAEVAPRAISKMITEVPILRGMNDDFARFEPQIDLADWKKLAKFYAGETRFDAATVAFIKRQNARPGMDETQINSLLENLKGYVALDTTRNDFLFHTQLYAWLNEARAEPLGIESFNRRVYEELFKTPDSDPWLGLYNANVYTALDGGGIVQ